MVEKNRPLNTLNEQDMNLFLKDVTPWVEAMVGAYFVQLLLQDLIPSWYADGSLYKVSWCDVEEVIVGDSRLLCAWVLEVNGHSVTSYRMIVNVPTPYSSRLLSFNMDEEPIIEVDDIDYLMDTTLQAYHRTHEEFQNLGVEANSGSFFVGAFKESLSHGLSLDVDNPIQTALAYRTDDRGCGYFMWMNDFRKHISSSGPSTPPTLYTRPSTRPCYSVGTFVFAMNVGKAECSNCKFLAENIKTLEAKIKILEMERHLENHTIKSTAILHELYNDMEKLGLE
ncbi:hypothetical protein Tco_0612622 [Tanacetum coccineum]